MIIDTDTNYWLYPFGMLMPGRKYSAGSIYRYGFNGKEMDNENYGESNAYNFGERIYNPRLGRFLSVDPLSSKFPFFTPFQSCGNDPINLIDIDGESASRPPFWIWFTEVIINGNIELTAGQFKSLASMNNVSPSYLPRLGRIFEAAVLSSINKVGLKKDIYPYPLTNPTKFFKPDAIEDFNFRRQEGTEITHRYTFTDAIITDVKFTTSRELPLEQYYNPEQIKGFIDYLANVRGVVKDGVPTNDKVSDYGVATLVIATNFGVEISDEIIKYAKDKNVSVYQRVAFERTPFNNESPQGNKNDKLKVSETFPLYQAKNKSNDPVITEAFKNAWIVTNTGQSETGDAAPIDWINIK